MPPDWTNTLAYIGLAAVAYTTYKFTRQATVYLLPSTLTKTHNPSGQNWALVTGATDGIGFGFCQELCARGFNVILHGRNASKLEQRARELEAEFPNCKTEIVVLDVVGVTSAAIDSVANQVRAITEKQGGDLSVLVNNVGGEVKPYTLLDGYTFDEAAKTVDMNAGFMLQITRALLPLLCEETRGLVLNVSSISAMGMPYISVYSASKGFVDTLTRALEAEVYAEGRNVDIMGLRVGQVRTAGFGVTRGLFIPNGRTLASAALNRVGCGQVIVWAYFWHWVQGLSVDLLPRSMMMKITTMKIKSLKQLEHRGEKAKST
ncbi:uncharacterized protein N7484_002643 [Penicillium longicatenatum]|uniref:uncharacterized protein n=1 Tax=Penicillium longicatenatum TaxID=1561947 RepID=UPI002548ED0E|nr:uncharacterized protein N7484_002643 [Penicillium longicatenatum]KAJ5648920.1 hypothetical protein N7484_002643 [Penicillium longicatenatum]KAJ5673604.1 hypothetical protein N7507_002731 [Penicillium longicatenatum]